MRFLLLAIALLLAAGCGDDGDDGASLPAPTTAASESRCTQASEELMAALASRLTVGDTQLTNGWLVQSAEHDGVYFIAAEIDSIDLPSSGDAGVWATTSPHSGEEIYSVDDLAKQYSDWGDATALDVSPDDVGVRESRSCVFR